MVKFGEFLKKLLDIYIQYIMDVIDTNTIDFCNVPPSALKNMENHRLQGFLFISLLFCKFL